MADKLVIASFNASREALNQLPPQDRSLYLTERLEAAGTDICFLPGDDTSVGLLAVQGYSQFLAPGEGDAVLLYNNARVRMRPQEFELTSFGLLSGLGYSKLVVPKVEVFTLSPNSKVIKTFNIVAWGHDLFSKSCVPPETLTESIITFAQGLAMTTHNSMLISGEIKLRYDNLVKILKKLSTDAHVKFLKDIQPAMAEHGYSPSMTETSLKETSNLFMMKVVRCNHQDIHGSNGVRPVVADCLIASKHLNLANASLTKVECRKISLTIKEPVPVIASLPLTVPKPTHHGG